MKKKKKKKMGTHLDRALALQRVVRVGQRVWLQRKEIAQVFNRRRRLLELAGADDRLQTLLAQLPLVHLLFDAAHGQEAIDVALFLLTVAPDARRRLCDEEKEKTKKTKKKQKTKKKTENEKKQEQANE